MPITVDESFQIAGIIKNPTAHRYEIGPQPADASLVQPAQADAQKFRGLLAMKAFGGVPAVAVASRICTSIW